MFGSVYRAAFGYMQGVSFLLRLEYNADARMQRFSHAAQHAEGVAFIVG